MVDVLKIPPDISAYPDDKYENLQINIDLPGVKKEDISFMLTDASFYIRATKGEVTYVGAYPLCGPVNPEKAVANYSNGVLKVTVPYKEPLEKLVDVKIK